MEYYAILDGDRNLVVYKLFSSLSEAGRFLNEYHGPDWHDSDYDIVLMELVA